MNKFRFLFILFAVLAVLSFVPEANAQRRDFLTDTEIDIVRDAQDIDTRIEVLVKMADRRFSMLGQNVGGWDSGEKNADKWGPPPEGTKLDLLEDIKRLLQKAIDDIDNLYAHPDSAPVRDPEDRKSRKRDRGRFGKAVRELAAASNRYLTPLRKLYDTAADDKERGLISDAINSCEEIIEASKNLPDEADLTYTPISFPI